MPAIASQENPTMKTIETRLTISEDRKLTMQLPQSVTPGEYCVLIVLEEKPGGEAGEPADLLHDCGARPEDL
jgi:hypothetical protein